jgi:hypothetical protein
MFESYLRDAESDDPENAMCDENALDVEVSGKFVTVLFCTGGPHFELLFEYEDAPSAEGWYEYSPQWAIAIYRNWGVADTRAVSAADARTIVNALERTRDDLYEAQIERQHNG